MVVHSASSALLAKQRTDAVKRSNIPLALPLSVSLLSSDLSFPSKPGTTRKPAGPRFAFDLTFPLPRISAGTGMSRGKGDVHTILRG